MGQTASLLAKAAPSLPHHSSIGSLSLPMNIFLELWTSLTNYEQGGLRKKDSLSSDVALIVGKTDKKRAFFGDLLHERPLCSQFCEKMAVFCNLLIIRMLCMFYFFEKRKGQGSYDKSAFLSKNSLENFCSERYFDKVKLPR